MDDDLLHVHVADGPYNGRYAIDMDDFTASEAGEFRKAVGLPIASLFSSTDKADIDGVAGLIWLLKRRDAKGLAYAAVADAITYGNCKMGDDASDPEPEDPTDPLS